MLSFVFCRLVLDFFCFLLLKRVLVFLVERIAYLPPFFFSIERGYAILSLSESLAGSYMCPKNGDHISPVFLISKVYILSELTQPTATIPTIWGEGSQVWTFCTNKCFFACLSLYDVFVPIFVYYSVAFFYDCLTYFQSRPQKSTALRPPGRLWWEQATI